MPNNKWRMFYVVLELLKPGHLSLTLQSGEAKLTVFELITMIFTSLLSGSGSVKNFNVKGVLMSQCFKPLVAKATACDKISSQKKTGAYLRILKQASLAEWMNAEDRSKQLTLVLKYLNILLDDDNIEIGDQVFEEFDTYMKEGFEAHYKEKKENQKVDLLQSLRRLV
jgi:hypothetical protein